MKIKEIADALPALQKIAAQDMPVALLYRSMKLLKKLDEEIAVFNRMRRDILGKYCDVESGSYVPREECIEQLNREWEDLDSLESEIKIKEKIVLPLDSGIRLSYNDMCLLEPFFEIESPEEEDDGEK
jgi:hypothetical protein